MKAAGSIAIGVAAILFMVALYTVYSYALTIDQATIRDHMDSPPVIPWPVQAGGEALIGAAFLIPGIVMVSRKEPS